MDEDEIVTQEPVQEPVQEPTQEPQASIVDVWGRKVVPKQYDVSGLIKQQITTPAVYEAGLESKKDFINNKTKSLGDWYYSTVAADNFITKGIKLAASSSAPVDKSFR